MKKLLIIAIAVGLTNISLAQQLPQYTQFFLNKFIMNPGATGTEKYWEAQATNRIQWVGIDDAPRTHVMSINGPISSYKMGIGAKFFVDVTGPTRRTGFSGSYSYKVKVSDDIKIGLGLSFGGLQYTVDGSQITLENPNDIALANGINSTFVPDAGFGFHMYSDEFYFGASMPQIIGNKVQFYDHYRDTEAALARHIFAYGGYKFQVSDDWMIEPAVLAKWVDPAPVSVEGNIRVEYKKMAWLGVSYRMQDAVGLLAGFNLNESIIFAYSYDMTTSELQTATSGSHELMIAIRFKNNSNNSKPD